MRLRLKYWIFLLVVGISTQRAYRHENLDSTVETGENQFFPATIFALGSFIILPRLLSSCSLVVRLPRFLVSLLFISKSVAVFSKPICVLLFLSFTSTNRLQICKVSRSQLLVVSIITRQLVLICSFSFDWLYSVSVVGCWKWERKGEYFSSFIDWKSCVFKKCRTK